MIVVIQCAASKNPGAGRFKTEDGRPVIFVADPTRAPADRGVVYKRPDDHADSGLSYREELVKYNRHPGGNSRGLLPAWKLYTNPVYAGLVDTFGIPNVFILSAGWGLIAARMRQRSRARKNNSVVVSNRLVVFDRAILSSDPRFHVPA